MVIMPFIRKSQKLNKIELPPCEVLNLAKINTERKELARSRKIIHANTQFYFHIYSNIQIEMMKNSMQPVSSGMTSNVNCQLSKEQAVCCSYNST